MCDVYINIKHDQLEYILIKIKIILVIFCFLIFRKETNLKMNCKINPRKEMEKIKSRNQ